MKSMGNNLLNLKCLLKKGKKGVQLKNQKEIFENLVA